LSASAANSNLHSTIQARRQPRASRSLWKKSPQSWSKLPPTLCGHPLRCDTSGESLNAEVWDIAQSVFEAVGKIGSADHQRQFHDLPLVVELPQFIQRSGTIGGGAARDALGVQDGGFILLVEQWAALVELQRLDLLVSEPESLRRSDVSAGSILAAV
jgi:hypothetical protein